MFDLVAISSQGWVLTNPAYTVVTITFTKRRRKTVSLWDYGIPTGTGSSADVQSS